MIYPWQSMHWERLVTNLDRMPHALLLAGPEGIGKREFAHALAARLLCEAPRSDGFACCDCVACKWVGAGTHPDLRVLKPYAAESGAAANEPGTGAEAAETIAPKPKRSGNQIVIDQVRQLQDFVGVGTHRQGWRIIVIEPAEAMNYPSVNAILKLLEEPAPSTLFLLVSDNPRKLSATLRSRCRRIAFGKPDPEQALGWLRAKGIDDPPAALAAAGGFPLLGATLAAAGVGAQREKFLAAVAAGGAGDPLQIAASWESWTRGGRGAGTAITLAILVDWLQKWLYDLVAYRLARRVFYHPARREVIAKLAEGARIGALIACYNEMLSLRRVADHPLNTRLFIEDMLLRYRRGVAAGAAAN